MFIESAAKVLDTVLELQKVLAGSATSFTEFVLCEAGSATRFNEFILYEVESAVKLKVESTFDLFPSPVFVVHQPSTHFSKSHHVFGKASVIEIPVFFNLFFTKTFLLVLELANLTIIGLDLLLPDFGLPIL